MTANRWRWLHRHRNDFITLRILITRVKTQKKKKKLKHISAFNQREKKANLIQLATTAATLPIQFIRLSVWLLLMHYGARCHLSFRFSSESIFHFKNRALLWLFKCQCHHTWIVHSLAASLCYSVSLSLSLHFSLQVSENDANERLAFKSNEILTIIQKWVGVTATKTQQDISNKSTHTHTHIKIETEIYIR